MKKPQLKQPGQYGGDGLYYLLDGTRRINKIHMSARAARDLNISRKKHGFAQWQWSGRRK
ncbi:MAG: hypothetical protein RIQ93_2485 [Verrucomicrobiota bacterium]